MSQVILRDTGWKYLPDTVSWPEKHDYPIPDSEIGQPTNDWLNRIGESYNKALTEASRHLVDIAEEDWERVRAIIYYSQDKGFLDIPIGWQPPQDKPITIDAEFEVVEQYRLIGDNLWFTSEFPISPLHVGKYEYRQIARLVKPKEYRLEQPTEGGIIGTEIGFKPKVYTTIEIPNEWNPTDSVTSDGTKVRDICSEAWFNAIANKQSFNDWWEGRSPQPTETQDELLHELRAEIYQIDSARPEDQLEMVEELKKHFRIERI